MPPRPAYCEKFPHLLPLFHQRLFKTLSDGHDFAGCLHLGAESTLRIDELVERPLWEFYHHIVDGRLEAGISVAGDGILISSSVNPMAIFAATFAIG